MGSTRERRVDDEAEAEAELSGGNSPDSFIGEVVEEGRRLLLEMKSGVADVVFVDERDLES